MAKNINEGIHRVWLNSGVKFYFLCNATCSSSIIVFKCKGFLLLQIAVVTEVRNTVSLAFHNISLKTEAESLNYTSAANTKGSEAILVVKVHFSINVKY